MRRTMLDGGVPRYELLLVLILTVLTARGAPGRPLARAQYVDSNSMTGAMDFLTKFGYLPQSDLLTGNLRTEEQLREAIREMQRFANLNATGIIDRETLKVMHKKRCGVPDLVGTSERVKRYAIQGAKWEKKELTWSLDKFTNTLNTHEVRRELTRAFKVWSDSTVLTFREVHSNSGSDISISFARGYHGDGYTFDGPGSVLAHAFFPAPGLGGDTHFDDEEAWRASSHSEDSDGVSLFAVAAHEFGHSLGLSHSKDISALMYPYYQWFGPDYSLPDDDRFGIEQMYGARNRNEFAPLPTIFPTARYTPRPTNPPYTRGPHVPGVTPPRTPPTPPPPTKKTPKPDKPKPEKPIAGKPKTCDTSYDAVSIIRGEIFIFKDKYFWRLDDRGVASNYPVEIDRFWYELPPDIKRIDAVYERPKDRKIVFFIGQKYWMFEANRPLRGFPKPLTQLGLPPDVKHIDAAMVWGHNGKTYFFSEKRYWRFDENDGRVELDYPRDMIMWKGVPYHIDSAFQGKDGSTYFFKGKGFWKFNNQKMKVDNEDPLPSAMHWMACDSTSSVTNKDIGDADSRTTVAASSVLSNACLLVVFSLALLAGVR